MLGTPALFGRTLSTADDPVGGRDVAVLSHALWTRRFGASPAIVGQQLQIDGVSREVVGVMPQGFAYPLQSELWIPLRFSARELETQRGAHYLDVLGRLRPEASLEEARAELRTIGAGLARAFPSTNRIPPYPCTGFAMPSSATCGSRCSSCSVRSDSCC